MGHGMIALTAPTIHICPRGELQERKYSRAACVRVRSMRASDRSSVVGLEAQSCVIPGQIVIVSRTPAPGHRPSRQLKTLLATYRSVAFFGLFFHEPAPKNFWGFPNRRLKFLTVRCVTFGCGSTLRPLESTWTAHQTRRAFLTVKLLLFLTQPRQLQQARTRVHLSGPGRVRF